ncbi:MAG: hypothetical protein C0417_10515 [Chlorobiaceae bacterium]|nr:hypothetical protein [Chlorobiaceae bacterium]
MTTSINRQEYYSALGRITVSTNHLEHWMRTCLLIIHGPDIFRFLDAWLATANFERVHQVLQFSFSYKISDKPTLEKFADICKQINDLNMERNKYIHSQWLFAIDDSFVIRTRKLKSTYSEHETEPSVAELNKLADDLGIVHKKLLAFINEVFPK